MNERTTRATRLARATSTQREKCKTRNRREIRKMKTESVTDGIRQQNSRWLRLKLPLNSRRPPDASILHCFCSASDKVASGPAGTKDKKGKIVNFVNLSSGVVKRVKARKEIIFHRAISCKVSHKAINMSASHGDDILTALLTRQELTFNRGISSKSIVFTLNSDSTRRE